MEQEAGPSGSGYRDVDIDDLLTDPELEKLHQERLATMQKEVEKRQALQRKGHGEYQEVQEGDFLEIVTSTERCVCHFFHREFERCKIIDKHLGILSRKFFDTRFIKMSAPVRNLAFHLFLQSQHALSGCQGVYTGHDLL